MNLFDYTQRGIEDQANAYAKMSDKEATRAMLYKAGAGIAGGVKGMLGVEDPDMKKASEIKLMTQGLDLTTAKGLKELAIKLGEKGYNQEGAMAAQRARELAKYENEEKKTIAETKKIEAYTSNLGKPKIGALQRDKYTSDSWRKYEESQDLGDLELVDKGANKAVYSPEGKLAINMGFVPGTPEFFEKVNEINAQRNMTKGKWVIDKDTQQAVWMPTMPNNVGNTTTLPTTTEAKWTGTTNNPESTIAGINSITDPVERQTAMKAFQQTQGIKTPASVDVSPTSVVAPSAPVTMATPSSIQKAENKVAASKPVERAKTLVNEIASAGGMTTESKSFVSNVLTALGTTDTGQAIARATGSPVQSKRDELNSLRNHLLNTIRESTGMSSKSIDSNAELKTWLDSLGAPGMSKEANLAILNNIEEFILKNKKDVSSSKEADWSFAWSKLKSGESMKGLDGKTYTKK